MRWAIKHKSGRTLFVTSDEFIANNRGKMGWIVEEVKMTSREQFNKWFYEYTGCDPKDSRYVNMVEMYWMAWQASRAAIEVATPWLCGDGDNDNEWTEGYNDGVMATEKAIISAGLKVKK
ncbi:hypothetical protein HC6_0029 [Escherichia phage HC6]|nr:hypothetical protein HC6_0029 [Escherichia phage HC6]UTI75212.1 hypothetical protein [Escherichia phage 6947]